MINIIRNLLVGYIPEKKKEDLKPRNICTGSFRQRKIFTKFCTLWKKKLKAMYAILKVMGFIQTTQWELGEKINLRNRNLDVIHYYLMRIRREHAIYNIHFLVLELRIFLGNLTARMFYKKKCLINYVQNEHIKKTLMVKPIEQFPKRELMVTWNKWLGGVLTNFKTIAKRILARLRTKDLKQEKMKHFVTYGKNLHGFIFVGFLGPITNPYYYWGLLALFLASIIYVFWFAISLAEDKKNNTKHVNNLHYILITFALLVVAILGASICLSILAKIYSLIVEYIRKSNRGKRLNDSDPRYSGFYSEYLAALEHELKPKKNITPERLIFELGIIRGMICTVYENEILYELPWFLSLKEEQILRTWYLYHCKDNQPNTDLLLHLKKILKM